jgi:hypothetical protein
MREREKRDATVEKAMRRGGEKERKKKEKGREKKKGNRSSICQLTQGF